MFRRLDRVEEGQENHQRHQPHRPGFRSQARQQRERLRPHARMRGPVMGRGDPGIAQLRRPVRQSHHLVDNLRRGAIGRAEKRCEMNADLHR
jgi:hypothetical protein